MFKKEEKFMHLFAQLYLVEIVPQFFIDGL